MVSRQSWGSIVVSSDSVVDSLVHAVNHDGEKEAEPDPDELEVDPVVHELVLLGKFQVLWSLLSSAKFEGLDTEDEVSNVDRKANSNEMVHLKEETEGTLLHLSSLWHELNQLIHGLHGQVNEHEPVDVLHVWYGKFVDAIFLLVIVSLDELHGHELEVKRDDSHSKGESHTDDLVHVVTVVVSSGIDPDTFVAFEKLTLPSSNGIL